MLKIAYDDSYVHLLPSGHRFPMQKYELIPMQLLYEGVAVQEDLFVPGHLDERYILLTHDRAYWERLKALSLSDKEIRRSGFPLSQSLLDRERLIAQGTVEAACYALAHGLSFNVAGGTHHAGSNWAEGFCLLNDQAIAASYLLHEKLAARVLIVDLDVHQGNGTADIFRNNSHVFTFSMHGEKNFPFRKERSDMDIGLGLDVTDHTYLDELNKHLPTVLERFRPDFVFYQSGVDVLATDKLGHLKLSMDGCKQRDELVFGLCKRYGLPVQVSMGGGYSAEIKHIVQAHCQTFKSGIAVLMD